MGKLALHSPTCEALGNISPSTLAAIWWDSSFIPAVAVSDDAQQGSHHTPLPQCSTASQWGTWYLCQGTQPVA